MKTSATFAGLACSKLIDQKVLLLNYKMIYNEMKNNEMSRRSLKCTHWIENVPFDLDWVPFYQVKNKI